MAKAKKMKLPSIKKKAKKAIILYIFLMPMFASTIASLFASDYIRFIAKLIGFGMLFATAKLIDRGLESEFNYNEATLAQAPKIKYKLIGSILLTLSLLYIGLFVTNLNILNTLFSSILGGVGAYIYYGKDPSVDKLPKEGGVNYQKLLKSLSEAREKLKSIDKDKEKIDNIELKSAIDKATKRAHQILNTIEQDPKDINIVRKFMVVYLDGVKDVISQYTNIDKEVLDNSYRDRLIELLEDASVRFEKELERIKSNELFDLDVQIDALKKQLNY